MKRWGGSVRDEREGKESCKAQIELEGNQEMLGGNILIVAGR